MISTFKFYFTSQNREVYRTIAREFHTLPIHVYRLAHGKRGKGDRDYYVIKRLKEAGVIDSTICW